LRFLLLFPLSRLLVVRFLMTVGCRLLILGSPDFSVVPSGEPCRAPLGPFSCCTCRCVPPKIYASSGVARLFLTCCFKPVTRLIVSWTCAQTSTSTLSHETGRGDRPDLSLRSGRRAAVYYAHPAWLAREK